MHTILPIRRLSLALALGLGLASLAAFAGETSDVTEVEITVAGKTEKVVLEDMKPGESRQLYSEAGTLVTAVRTADGIELDIAGEKTRIAMLDDELSPEALVALIDAEGDDGKVHRVVKVHHDGDTHASHSIDGKRTVVLVSGDDADVHTLDEGTEDISVLLDEAGAGAGDGKRVIVKRRIVRDDAAGTAADTK